MLLIQRAFYMTLKTDDSIVISSTVKFESSQAKALSVTVVLITVLDMYVHNLVRKINRDILLQVFIQ